MKVFHLYFGWNCIDFRRWITAKHIYVICNNVTYVFSLIKKTVLKHSMVCNVRLHFFWLLAAAVNLHHISFIQSNLNVSFLTVVCLQWNIIYEWGTRKTSSDIYKEKRDHCWSWKVRGTFDIVVTKELQNYMYPCFMLIIYYHIAL